MRNDPNRIHESDLYIPILRLLASSQNGFMTTSDLIAELEEIFQPEGEDAEILSGRRDTRFSQIVRNIVSHRNTPGNPIAKGFANYDESRNGLGITEKGREFLSDVPT